jgi:hypothetical protein
MINFNAAALNGPMLGAKYNSITVPRSFSSSMIISSPPDLVFSAEGVILLVSGVNGCF